MRDVSRSAIFWLSLMILSASIAQAQPMRGLDRGFGVSPSYVSVQVQPGERIHATMTLSNLGRRGTGIYAIEVSDLGQSEQGAVTPVPHGQGARSCVEWIEVPAEVQIPAGGNRKIRVPIRCPAGATGAYYAILNVTVAPATAEDRDMVVAVQPAIGVTLEVKTPHPAPSHLEPAALMYRTGAGGTSPSLLLSVRNTGVWKKSIEGDILVYDRPGQFPVRAPVPYRNSGNPHEVYPGQTVRLNCPLPRRLRAGNHSVSVRLRLTENAQARRSFQLHVPAQAAGTAETSAWAGEKAEFDVDLSVEPPFVEIAIPPGGRRAIGIKVRNADTREVRVSGEITRARMEPDGMFTYPDISPDQAVDWLAISPETFRLEPKRSTTVRAQVSIPAEGLDPMPLVGVVRLQAVVPEAARSGEWSAGGEFPVVIIVQDPQLPQAQLEIESLRIVRSAPGQNPSAAVLEVRNSGDKVARVEGRILFERAGGQEIARMDIGRSQPELILPGSKREFRMTLGPLDDGTFRVQAEIAMAGMEGSKKRARTTFDSAISVSVNVQK